jgi:hypothetical protein
MTPQEFETRIVDWAKKQPQVEALIQIGSRVQLNAEIDEWSDWDYQLIVRDVRRLMDPRWLTQIAPYWSAHVERTERAIPKMSVVFAGGYEADFVLLSAWQMKLVYWAMARPGLQCFFPKILVRGVMNTQLVVRPGYKVLIGGEAWEQRLASLRVAWPGPGLTESDYESHVSGFWRHAVWIEKKISRGELRAALRWYSIESVKHRWVLLEEEARLAGRSPRPEARKAERWLDAKRLAQTTIETGTDQRILARALLSEITLFEEISRSVAISRGFPQADYSALATWLRSELNKIAQPG